MFLTVKEAIDISGKSQTTIHRLCQKYEGTKYVQKENNKYLVDKDFLLDKYPVENESFSPSNMVNPQNGESLLKSLIEKNQTITSLTIENNELNQKLTEKITEIQKLQSEIQNTKQDSGKTIDISKLQTGKQNASIGVSTGISISQIPSKISELQVTDKNSKSVLKYQIIGISISVLVVIAFIFLMYYLTK
jgi:predicted RNase H-like nuclease (RuvC/YqgF family)